MSVQKCNVHLQWYVQSPARATSTEVDVDRAKSAVSAQVAESVSLVERGPDECSVIDDNPSATGGDDD